MTRIEPTLTIQVDETNILKVEDMSPKIKEMVAIFDDWRQDETNQVSQLLKTRAALREMQQSIGLQLQEEAKEQNVESSQPVEPQA